MNTNKHSFPEVTYTRKYQYKNCNIALQQEGFCAHRSLDLYLFVQQEASSVMLYMNFRKTCQIQRYVQELVVLYKCYLCTEFCGFSTTRKNLSASNYSVLFWFDILL